MSTDAGMAERWDWLYWEAEMAQTDVPLLVMGMDYADRCGLLTSPPGREA